MEKLYELRSGGDFDVVVVDTPPTRHALDFIDAPRRLTRFLDHRLYRVLTAPTRGVMKAVNAAAQTFIRGVSKVVGADVFDDAIAFFQAFEGMEEGFKERAYHVLDLLNDPSTAFVLVASPKRDTVEEARFFADKLAESRPAGAGTHREPHAPTVRVRLARGRPRSGPATLAGTDLGELYANLADFELVAAREEEHLEGLAEQVAPAPVVRVPFLRSDVHDLAGLDEVGTHLFAQLTAGSSRDARRWRAGSGPGRPGRAAAGSRPWARASWRRWRRPPGPARGSPACGSRPSPSGRGPGPGRPGPGSGGRRPARATG